MPFAIHCLDKPDSGAVRMAARPDHLAYLVGFEDKIVFAGPLLADDHQAMIGSLLILDLPDRAAAGAILRRRPLSQGGTVSNSQYHRLAADLSQEVSRRVLWPIGS